MRTVYLRVHEIAERYGVADSTVLRWIKDGKLRAIRPGRAYLVAQSDLIEFEQLKGR